MNISIDHHETIHMDIIFIAMYHHENHHIEQSPFFSPEKSCTSGEHVWPKSHAALSTKAPGPGTDLHNLHPADVSVNAERGNKADADGLADLGGWGNGAKAVSETVSETTG